MRQFLFGTALFISSACGLVVEIVAGRLLAPYVGMSLYSWTAIIAVVLAGLSVGHWVGGVLAPPHVKVKIGARRISWALGFAAISTLSSLVLLRTVSGLLMQSQLTLIPIIVLLATALFFLPSFFVGIVSPILTKIAVDESKHHTGRVIGQMYALGTLGSIAGTLSSGYFFISWIGSTGTIIMVTAVYAIMALLFAIADQFRFLVVAVIGGGGALLSVIGNNADAFSSPCDIESDYFCIRVDNYDDPSVGPSRLMALDHLVHSINVKDDPGFLVSPYIQFVDEYTKIIFGKKSPQAFFIGGGGFTLPRAWAHDYSDAKIIVAEIDPAVTTAAKNLLWLDVDAPGLNIVHMDARSLLQKTPSRPTFDIIFGDAFHDISIPPHLVSVEFHDEIARRLNPNGFYAINVVDLGADPRFMLSLVKTLKESFPVVDVWVDETMIGGMDRVTYVVVAKNFASGQAKLQSQRGPDRTWARWLPLDLEKRIKRSDLSILSDDFAPVDRLMAVTVLKP
ncbi:MAG: fused MFS/spermidine synthase [Rhodospirillaceae bacterium]|nr:fused MFS/spermidine synthase [Rhodospirillaceae bacterium]